MSEKTPSTADQTACPHGCDTSRCPCLACEADQTERRDRYAAVVREFFGDLPFVAVLVERCTDAVMAVADAEQAALRAEVEQWRATFGRDALPGALRRLKTAEVAIEQVRGLAVQARDHTAAGLDDYRIGRHDLAVDILAELDGTEPPAADARTAIADVLSIADGWHWGHRFDRTANPAYQRYLTLADKVLAALPDQRATIRAAALREAADAVYALDYDVMVGEEGDENLSSMREAWDVGTVHATELLRRMADGEQPTTETPAEPPTVRWRLEMLDGIWASYGPAFTDRAEAVARYRSDSKERPTWNDVTRTPVQRRLVRETTTYTVETTEARQDGDDRG